MAGIEPLASRVPYMVVTGNHEYGARGATCLSSHACVHALVCMSGSAVGVCAWAYVWAYLLAKHARFFCGA
jgi:hypothetical protein